MKNVNGSHWMKWLFAIGAFWAFFAPITAQEEQGVAKIIVLRGTVLAKNANSDQAVTLQEGNWLLEGASIQTHAKSFAKLLFIDKSQMSVGPESQIIISQFPKTEAGIINVLKGQIRSQVTKNYMEMDSADKSKLFIKTKTAAMGVRGTDFQVNFNPDNNVTALITFSGSVMMAKIDDLDNNQIALNPVVLEKVVSSKEAVAVTKGLFSGAAPNAARVSLPVKINPVQLETLKKTTDDAAASTGEKVKDQKETVSSGKAAYRSPIPPGVQGKVFANNNNEIAKTVTSIAGMETMKAAEKETATATTASNAQVAPPPEGMYNAKTQEFAPAAGGFVDLNTALYVAPPPGSTFDANTGVYLPPPEMGKVDAATGAYLPPEGLKLTASGEFIAAAKVEAEGGARAPASTTAPPAAPVTAPAKVELYNPTKLAAAEANFAKPVEIVKLPDTPVIPITAIETTTNSATNNLPISTTEIEQIRQDIQQTIQQQQLEKTEIINQNTQTTIIIK